MRSWPAPVLPELPPAPQPPVRVRDSASGELGEVARDRAGLYVCGITPYDATHLGHAATYVAFDLLVRTWRDAGLDVTYVQNVTDVDDPLLERAAALGEDWRNLAERETDLFRADMTALRVLPPAVYAGAVESIPDVVRAVERMVADGTAYPVAVDDDDDAPRFDVYADLSADPRFGTDTYAALERTEALAIFAEMGGDPDRSGKRDPLDPLLWRAERPGEPAWDGGLLGPGRPGWHIECAVIAVRELGAPFAVGGGGADLRFPHHAMSASHVRTLTGVAHPVAAHLHTGLVAYDGHKISKSRGNLVLVSRLLADGVDPMAIRLALLAHHYAQPWEYSDADLERAQERLARWRRAVALASGPDSAAAVSGMRSALRADLDAPGAIAVVDQWADAALGGQGEPHDADAPAAVRAAVDALLGVAL